MSAYILGSGMNALYYAGMLDVPPIGVGITTTELDIALLGKLSRNGFALGQPCNVGLRAIDMVPDLSISRSKGLHFKA